MTLDKEWENKLRETLEAPVRSSIPEWSINRNTPDDCSTYTWRGQPYCHFVAKVDNFYNEMVFYKRNMFKLLTGRHG